MAHSASLKQAAWLSKIYLLKQGSQKASLNRHKTLPDTALDAPLGTKVLLTINQAQDKPCMGQTAEMLWLLGSTYRTSLALTGLPQQPCLDRHHSVWNNCKDLQHQHQGRVKPLSSFALELTANLECKAAIQMTKGCQVLRARDCMATLATTLNLAGEGLHILEHIVQVVV